MEYGVWIGIPLAMLTGWSCIRALRSVMHRQTTPIGLHNLAVICVFLAVALLGQTKGEAARLWVFLTPVVCIGASWTLSNRKDTDRSGMLWLVVLLQLATTYLIKENQGFW